MIILKFLKDGEENLFKTNRLVGKERIGEGGGGSLEKPRKPRSQREVQGATKRRLSLLKLFLPEAKAEGLDIFKKYQKIPVLEEHPERIPAALENLKKAQERIGMIYRIQLERKKRGKNFSPIREIGFKIVEKILQEKNLEKYLPLMIKESFLDPGAKSISGAQGYFQITDSAKGDLDQYFGIKTSYFETIDLIIKNCLAGILYFNLIRFHYLPRQYPKLEKDQELMVLMIYNAGPTKVKNLWNALKPKDYQDFEEKLSSDLAKALGSSKKKPEMTNDEESNVNYLEYPGIEIYRKWLKENPLKLEEKVSVAGIKISLRKLGEMLRFPRMIEAISKITPLSEREKIGISEEGRKYLSKEEILTKEKLIWSLADGLIKDLEEIRDLLGFTETDDFETRNSKRAKLIAILIIFNQEFNPKLSDLNDEGTNIKEYGIPFYIPNSEYIKAKLKEFEGISQKEGDIEERRKEITEIKGEKIEVLLKKIPIYADPSLDKEGNEILQKSDKRYKNAKKKLKKLFSEGPLNPNEGQEKERERTYIILHSTATKPKAKDKNVITEIKRANSAHFVVGTKDGITYVSHLDNIIDHMGDMDNKVRKAKWRDDGHLKDSSLGIEVIASPGEEWNKAQYESLKWLIDYLRGEYGIPAKNILGHYQVACFRVESSRKLCRGRKPDPFGNILWGKFDLPDNSQLIDPDVVLGKVESNIETIRFDMKNLITKSGVKSVWYKEPDGKIRGLIKSVELAKEKKYKDLAKAIDQETLKKEKAEMKKDNNFVSYKVQRGDSLYKIAHQHNSSVCLITKWNGLNTTSIKPGQQLDIPVPKKKKPERGR